MGTKWEAVTPALNKRKLVLAPWCEDPETEEQMKQKTNEEALELASEDATTPNGGHEESLHSLGTAGHAKSNQVLLHGPACEALDSLREELLALPPVASVRSAQAT